MPVLEASLCTMAQTPDPKIEDKDGSVAIYHSVSPNEGFDQAAQALVRLVAKAQELHPDKKRVLYLDIEGHRNAEGGFDGDMFELQQEFVLGFLLRFLTEARTHFGGVKNPEPQDNAVPDSLTVEEKPRG